MRRFFALMSIGGIVAPFLVSAQGTGKLGPYFWPSVFGTIPQSPKSESQSPKPPEKAHQKFVTAEKKQFVPPTRSEVTFDYRETEQADPPTSRTGPLLCHGVIGDYKIENGDIKHGEHFRCFFKEKNIVLGTEKIKYFIVLKKNNFYFLSSAISDAIKKNKRIEFIFNPAVILGSQFSVYDPQFNIDFKKINYNKQIEAFDDVGMSTAVRNLRAGLHNAGVPSCVARVVDGGADAVLQMPLLYGKNPLAGAGIFTAPGPRFSFGETGGGVGGGIDLKGLFQRLTQRESSINPPRQPAGGGSSDSGGIGITGPRQPTRPTTIGDGAKTGIRAHTGSRDGQSGPRPTFGGGNSTSRDDKNKAEKILSFLQGLPGDFTAQINIEIPFGKKTPERIVVLTDNLNNPRNVIWFLNLQEIVNQDIKADAGDIFIRVAPDTAGQLQAQFELVIGKTPEGLLRTKILSWQDLVIYLTNIGYIDQAMIEKCGLKIVH